MSLQSLLSAGTSSLNARQLYERQSVIRRLRVLLWSNRMMGGPAMVLVLLIALSPSVRRSAAAYVLPILPVFMTIMQASRLWSLNWRVRAAAAAPAPPERTASVMGMLGAVVPGTGTTGAGMRGSMFHTSAPLVRQTSIGGAAGALDSPFDRAAGGLGSFKFPPPGQNGGGGGGVAPLSSGPGAPLAPLRLNGAGAGSGRPSVANRSRHHRGPSASVSCFSEA